MGARATQQGKTGQVKMSELAQEAVRALAVLDTDRLEELAATCRHLGDPSCPTHLSAHDGDLAALQQEVRTAAPDLKTLNRVLEATRANAAVIRRLAEMRAEQPEYTPGACESLSGN